MRAHDPTPRRRGRPRDPDRETRILEATIAEYAERGWSGLTIDAVARRAGVGKSTIYLRWSDRDALLADAFSEVTQDIEPVDTGSLRGDLESLARRLHEHYTRVSGRASLRVFMDVATGSTGPTGHIDDFASTINDTHRQAALDILTRATRRGEVGEEVDGQLVINSLYGAMILEVLMNPWVPTDDAEAATRKVVDFVLHGMAPWLRSVV